MMRFVVFEVSSATVIAIDIQQDTLDGQPLEIPGEFTKSSADRSARLIIAIVERLD